MNTGQVRIRVRNVGRALRIALCMPSVEGRTTEDKNTKKYKLHGLSPRANYTDRATAACRRSHCQLLRIEGAMWSA
jgi:hypothetical protein